MVGIRHAMNAAKLLHFPDNSSTNVESRVVIEIYVGMMQIIARYIGMIGA